MAFISTEPMPRRDRYHDIVKEALIKDGWIITHDPLRIGQKDRKVILALSVDAFSSLLTEAEIADYISEVNIHLMTFNPTFKEIEQWIN